MESSGPNRPNHSPARRRRAARALGTLAILGILALPLVGSAFVKSRFLPNDAEHARLGTRCSAHPNVRLESDLVTIRYSFAGGGDYDPNLFPNARVVWSGGCVDFGPRFTEVAYCRECRRAYERWVKRNRRHWGE